MSFLKCKGSGGMKRIMGTLLACICMLAFAACGQEDEEKADLMQVYYVSNSETRVEMHEVDMQGAEESARLQKLMDSLSTSPEMLEYKAPLDMGFRVLGTKLEEGNLSIDVDAAYNNLPAMTEVLVRAAVVRTLTQLPEVKLVTITVEGNQLLDRKGNMIGWMNADQFIDNDGNEINTYELAKVKLYFAGESGTELIAAYREKHYSTNTPMERFVVEELIAGPSGQIEGLYPSINPGTKIINVMTKDGVCYVNLDETFLNVVNNVSTDVSIYSIVNSLVELNNINKVQIMINGEVPSSFSTSTFERNLDIVVTPEN